MGSGVCVDTPSDLCRGRRGQSDRGRGEGVPGVGGELGKSMHFYRKNCAPQPKART